MSKSINELVREQIAAEGPQFGAAFPHERYITREINRMNPSELLERISDAVDTQQRAALADFKNWL